MLICHRLVTLLLPLLAVLAVLILAPTTLAASLGDDDAADTHNIGHDHDDSSAGDGSKAKLLTKDKEIKYATGHRNSFMIHPGTRWCGVGTLAMNYTSLGPAFASDMCCRDHDHCANVIHAKETRYHFTSIFHFTVSHCECDVKFYNCLREAKDSQGPSVIDWFFRLVQVPCFELVQRQVCLESRPVSLLFPGATECVRTGPSLQAELRQLPYFTDELARMLRDQGAIHYSQ